MNRNGSHHRSYSLVACQGPDLSATACASIVTQAISDSNTSHPLMQYGSSQQHSILLRLKYVQYQSAPKEAQRRKRNQRYAELMRTDPIMTGKPNLKNCQKEMG